MTACPESDKFYSLPIDKVLHLQHLKTFALYIYAKCYKCNKATKSFVPTNRELVKFFTLSPISFKRWRVSFSEFIFQ